MSLSESENRRSDNLELTKLVLLNTGKHMIVKQIGEIRSDHKKIILFEDEFSDEYFWEFVDTMDLIHQIIPIEHIVDFEQSGGMILLEDHCEDLNRFQHNVQLSAWHHEEKWLTWIKLVQQQPNSRTA